jgi:hypothetical protein
VKKSTRRPHNSNTSGKQLTLFAFPAQYSKNKSKNLVSRKTKLYQKIHAERCFVLVKSYNRNRGPATTEFIIAVQKLIPTPQKALNLTGGRRGNSKKL